MDLENILSGDRCFCQINGVSKKRLFNQLSELIAKNCAQLDANNVFEALMARERLGSTGLGKGIAIPHCKVSECDDIIGALVTLDNAIEFDAIDDKPVDLLFFLIVPQQQSDEHIKALAHIAELFNDEDFCFTLRHTQDNVDLFNIAITY